MEDTFDSGVSELAAGAGVRVCAVQGQNHFSRGDAENTEFSKKVDSFMSAPTAPKQLVIISFSTYNNVHYNENKDLCILC